MNKTLDRQAIEFAVELLRRDLHLFQKNGSWICYGKTSGVLEVLSESDGLVIREVLEQSTIPDLPFSCLTTIARLAQAISAQKVYRQGVGSVLSTQLNMTDSCNMGCSYCYGMYYDNDPRSTKMSVDTAIQCVEFSHKIGAKAIGFFGGEPLLNVDAIRAAVGYARSNGYDFEFSMTTNGVMLTEEVADFLQDYKFTVSVSIDGPQEVHGITRKMRDGVSNSFDRTWRGIEILKSRGLLYMLEMTYSDKHPEDLKSILGFLSKHTDYISCTCVEGHADSKFSDEIIRGRRLVAYYRDMFEFYEECIESGQPTALAGINEFVLTVQEPVSVIREHVCSSLLDRVSIGYDGTVYPCPETMKNKFAILNVHEPDTYERFEPQRSLVLESLKKKNLQNLWFGNLMDICIGRISTNETGELHIDDVDSISDALEENLYRIAKSRAAEQNNVRVS